MKNNIDGIHASIHKHHNPITRNYLDDLAERSRSLREISKEIIAMSKELRTGDGVIL